ncbi:hypothetical protein H8E88_02680 [candidate division KSB1 bacterium]|nr:hypothetical protein [candidate division KSB1 bacterium]
MPIKKPLILIAVIAIFVTGLFAGRIMKTMGTTDSPAGPGATSSYNLENIYQRLDNGAAGAQTTFTEPTVPPGTGTMHTLNEIMDKAPNRDDTNGATTTQVLAGQTFWGLTASQWATQTGTMPNNGAGSTIVPTLNASLASSTETEKDKSL